MMAELGLPENPFLFEKEDWVYKEKTGTLLKKEVRVYKSLFDEYEIEKEINRGAFGVVYRARDRKSKETVAMKEEVGGGGLLMEIDILKSLPRHPNIVEFKKVARDGARVFVVMEYLEYDLQRVRAVMEQPFPLSITKTLMREILRGVAFLHHHGVVHRDLKPANILFGGANYDLKICDFGLSARLGSRCSAGAGTRWYKAPEVLGGCRSYTSAIDVWSVGCIMAEFVLDQPLFQGQSDAHQLACIREVLCGRTNLLRPLIMSASGAAPLNHAGFHLLGRLLAYHPNNRISAADALRHPWFAQQD
ncbi:cyclin-dependent kinase G-2-like [Salvia miltiorrhiza]|uniref:cyclin-dependent kinase G-2-like n=1 Tax=Salvia miltiorrhiza TaxID=226208 RepID=UPI0025AD624D|nr:cyclin-dependent kinase G-2-like [Salvia miltiorrhiza]